MSFSIPVSLTGLIRNQFKTLLLSYSPKEFFTFGILDARFEPTFTNKLLNVSAMEFLFTIIFLSTNREFGDNLVLDFSVTTGFIPSRVFF